MARSGRYEWTEAKILRFEQEGRGLGERSAYKPWITNTDFSSKGCVSRPPSIHGRPLQLFSRNELRCACLSLFDKDVIDLREQFPLPRTATMAVAQDLGFRHPAHRTAKFPLVMTTDLLETRMVGGKPRLRAVSVKPAEELDERLRKRGAARTREILDIERHYWEGLGVEFSLVLDEELKADWVDNVLWIVRGPNGGKWVDSADAEASLIETLAGGSTQLVRHACLENDRRRGLTVGNGLGLFRRMLARHRLQAPLDQGRLPDLPCSALLFPDAGW